MRRRFREVVEIKEIQECKNERNLPYVPDGYMATNSEPIKYHKSIQECREFWDMMKTRVLGI